MSLVKETGRKIEKRKPKINYLRTCRRLKSNMQEKGNEFKIDYFDTALSI